MSLSFEDHQGQTVMCDDTSPGHSRSTIVAEFSALPEILRKNKDACRFALSDADAALDMAGFVRNQLCGQKAGMRLSPALLALALVQSLPQAPDQ